MNFLFPRLGMTLMAFELVYIVFFSILFVFALAFFCVGWKLASYKNRDKLTWALTISVSGLYGVATLAALSKVEENVDE